MNSILCHTKISSKIPALSVGVSDNLMLLWGIRPGQNLSLQLGQKKVQAKVIRYRSNTDTILLTPTLSRQLSFPFHSSIRVSYTGRSLRFGPVVGIFTTGASMNSSSPFGSRTSLFRSFLVAGAQDNPIYYVFTKEDIDWKNKTVHGWFYQTIGWKKSQAPLPDVIFDRIPNRKVEKTGSIQATMQRLKSLNIPIFNQGFFDKGTVHRWLTSNPETDQYVPESILSPTIRSLSRLLDHHKIIYLKPVSGSLGLGIYRVTKHPKDGYYIRYFQGNRAVLQRFATLDKLIAQYFTQGRLQRYMAQQAIHLVRDQNKPVDFRVHLHKDETDKWKVITIAAKKAGEGCVTTHVRTGGELLSTEDFLQKIYPDRVSAIKRQISLASITIAQTVEANYEGVIGELGLDIGIDKNGHIWVFECNSKPGRHIFHHPTQKAAGRESARHIAIYSRKLSNFV
ncbi:YheC/YheD family endospore coat-associated protein [Risungbinella massiliensis]|uniref:YheC/YheD family endospore coat-associated protein n=1 Tax=Risungbinella massiliensis TaxID=1329796 RepID=UPI00069A7C6F|nr:YheC/YheD family protein [Risungbinella massiliensis]